MVKIREREDGLKTRCAICWQVLRPKSPLLHGMKCMKFEIRKKLKYLLPPWDFQALYDEKVFTNPRICNMCFVTIKRIPRTIAKLEGLLGKTINTRLYKPQRAEWSETATDSLQTESRLHTSQRDHKLPSVYETNSLSSGDKTASSDGGKRFGQAAYKKSQVLGTKSEPFREVSGESDNDAACVDPQEYEDEYNAEVDKSSQFPRLKQKVNTIKINKDKTAAMLSSPEVLVKDNLQRKGDQVSLLSDDVLSNIKNEDPTSTSADRQSSSENEDPTSSFADRQSSSQNEDPTSSFADRQSSIEYEDPTSNSVDRQSSSKIKNQPATACSEIRENEKWLRTSGQCKGVHLKPRKIHTANQQTRRTARLLHESRNIDHDQTMDISYSNSEDEYVPPSSKIVKGHTTLWKSSDNQRSKKNVQLRKKGKCLSLYRISKPDPAILNKKNISTHLKITLTQLKSKQTRVTKTDLDRLKNKDSSTQVKTNKNNNFATIIKTDIPENLNEHSKRKLRDLENEVKKFIDGKKKNIIKVLITCAVSGCDHVYPLWHHLAIHVKYYHHDGAHPAEGDFIQKLLMLADGDQLDQEKYQFQCRHTDCHLAFTNDESLKEHESLHGTNLLMCGFPDCTKAFKVAKSLRVHLSSHTGEKPHKCDAESCDKTFLTVSELTNHKSTHDQGNPLCCDVCGKQYLNDKGLIRHRRRIHGIGKPGRHKCPYEGCSQSFVKKEKLEIHICSHSPERKLFCEKCGKKFSCQRYLDVHYKIHIKNENFATNPPPRSIECEFPGCAKMFTTRENMKSHFLNQHRGRKPKSVPGIFFPCAVVGCGRKFSFRSTLYRHNKLVHKGGDYKLGRAIVKYVCKYEGCTMEFNRKNLLEEHMVMEHGKIPKRLLPLQNKELDFIERICIHCGMALTVAQLPRHEEIYHSDRAVQDMKESSPYPCHLKGCEQAFNTREDRKSHVQEHIESPPFRCQIEDCQMTFFLEKNLDNHLWSHSMKVSTCDFEGCSLKFDDQFQLAKHSKIHYNGKMKCPWPNCDNWLTETGHLKPHFIAHSRSLLAHLDSDFICEICELAFSSKWGLMIHKRMHGEEAAAKPTMSKVAKFTCEEDGCKATFADQKGFFDHFLFHYTNKLSSCNHQGCSENFRNMITMSRHTKCHYGGKFKCPWQGCTKIFASVFIVKKHVYRHIISNSEIASNQLYSCNQCFMVFKLEGNLLSHQEHHNEKSDYVCPTCGKKGRHNHMKAHRLSSKPHKSQECQQCGARYATISGLKFHLLQKHKLGKWPFKCSFCGKGFVSSREMQRHIPSHTKEKPFTCEICGVSFASHTGHRGHMRKHTGEKYICDVEGCGKVYSTPLSLRGHKAQHAGFSQICKFCYRTFRNPYGHKCKAGLENKKKVAKLGLSHPMRSFTTVQASLLPHSASSPQQQTSSSSLAPVVTPTTTSMQHSVMVPQQIITHTMEIQQATRTITHALVMPHSVAQGISQDLPQGIPQATTHSLSGQDMMQDSGQSGPMDMTRGASMDVTGDYTFNNYVVYWDSQNLS